MHNSNERLTLAHGSGGELSNQLLEEDILRILSNAHLTTRHDGAILNLTGPLAFTTDSFVVSPIFFPGGNIGDLAINGTVNDLAMCGAKPSYLALSLILEEGFGKTELRQILHSIRKAADLAGVTIVTGDTKVVERGKGDQIFINTSGIGQVHPKANINANRIQPGDKLLISGPVANHGMAIMSVREGLAFESEIKSDTRSLHREVLELLEVFGPDIHLLRDPTRGGVATILNEIARQTQLGIAIDERSIPANTQVLAACEMLGIDPLYVANEGILVAWVAASISEQALALLQQTEAGRYATILGTVVNDHPGQVVMSTEIGGRRVVAMPAGEQLPRIC